MSISRFFSFLLLATLFATQPGCAWLRVADNDPPTEDEIEEARQAEHERLQAAIDSKDLVLGMGMRDVYRVWGEPMDVETAGLDGSGNQRWTYLDGLSAFESRRRIVYFEAGKVVGWETLNR